MLERPFFQTITFRLWFVIVYNFSLIIVQLLLPPAKENYNRDNPRMSIVVRVHQMLLEPYFQRNISVTAWYSQFTKNNNAMLLACVREPIIGDYGCNQSPCYTNKIVRSGFIVQVKNLVKINVAKNFQY